MRTLNEDRRLDPETARNQTRNHQNGLVKPPGSLGRLEEIAVFLAGIQRTVRPSSRPAACLIFASDHPVASEERVSAFPASITAAMMDVFANGGAASTVMADALSIPIRIIDVGVDAPYAAGPESRVPVMRRASSTSGCGNLRKEDAMSRDVFDEAWVAGSEAVDAVGPVRLLLLGEMGIGNTTAAAAVAAFFLNAKAIDVVGAGTGLSEDQLPEKTAVVQDALDRVQGSCREDALRRLGGRELVALTSAMTRAASLEIAIVVDGFIATAAALAAVSHEPAVREYLLFSHRSAESGHRLMLESLGASPLVDLGMRLGEATGALAVLPLIDLACETHNRMWKLTDLERSDGP